MDETTGDAERYRDVPYDEAREAIARLEEASEGSGPVAVDAEDVRVTLAYLRTVVREVTRMRDGETGE